MACTIGITCGWDEKNNWHKLHEEYISAVKEAGGVPFLLPGLDSSELVAVYYNQLDGFIFSGGGDVDPFYYNEEPLQGLGEVTARRDCFELALARLVLQGDKPAMGICRGMQVLNIASGGDIYQDIQGQGVTKQLHNQQAARWHSIHSVEVDQTSYLFQLAQKATFKVNSFHHQAVRQVGERLRAVAWSKDGLVEALESFSEENRNCELGRIIGVQWHPECNWSVDEVSFSLFKNLIDRSLTKKGS